MALPIRIDPAQALQESPQLLLLGRLQVARQLGDRCAEDRMQLGGGQEIAAAQGYVPLPAAAQTVARNGLKTITYSGAVVLK